MRLALVGLACCALACSAGSSSDGSDGAQQSAPGAPEAPGGITTRAMGGGAHLSWTDNATNETGFVLHRKTLGGTFASLAETAFDVTEFHDQPLQAGTVYVYRVAAINAAGRSAFSPEASFQMPGNNSSSSGGPSSSSASSSSSSSGAAASSSSSSSSGAASSSSGNASSSSSSGAASSSSSGIIPRPNFEDDVVPIFEASCGTGTNGCHDREAYWADVGSNCRGWLSLENVPLGRVGYGGDVEGRISGCPDLGLFERLMTLRSWQCGNGLPYVVPGNTDASYLWAKINGGPYCDNQPGVPSDPMPGDGEALTTTELETIRDWIEAGAPRRP